MKLAQICNFPESFGIMLSCKLLTWSQRYTFINHHVFFKSHGCDTIVDYDKPCAKANLYENYLRNIVWKNKKNILDRINIFGH